jgi:hypothetical protein
MYINVYVYIYMQIYIIYKHIYVKGDITAEDIESAKKSKYDAIFSELKEEYVLLKPEYVLPEFILHLHYVPGVIHDKDMKIDINISKNIQNNENSMKINDLKKTNSNRNIFIKTKKMTLPRSLVSSNPFLVSSTTGELRILIYVCMYIHIYTYACIYMYIYVCICIHAYVYICLYACIHIHMYDHMNIGIHIYIYMYT